MQWRNKQQIDREIDKLVYYIMAADYGWIEKNTILQCHAIKNNKNNKNTQC